MHKYISEKKIFKELFANLMESVYEKRKKEFFPINIIFLCLLKKSFLY